MALQLRRFGILQHMVLADERATCLAGYARWPWLGCGWSAGLPGFEDAYRDGIGGETAHLWSLWSAKWLLVARLTELRVSVLALDTDMVLQRNPYPLMHAPPLLPFHMVIVPEGSRVNLGFIYTRGVACAPTGGVASVLWDVVRRLRLFTEDYPLRARNNRTTSTYGLWDQGLFTDAITSAVMGQLVYPYTYLQSPKTAVWPALKWPPSGMSVRNLSRMHMVPWRDGGDRRLDSAWLTQQAQTYGAPTHATRPTAYLPPRGHPQRREWEGRRVPLMWAPLHVLDPLAHLRSRALSAVTPGWLEGAAKPPTTTTTAVVAASGGGAGGAGAGAGGGGGGAIASALAATGPPELLLATPDWLYCLVGRWAITAGWPSLNPRAVCAVLHLVECRSQFGTGWNANKLARPYVQRALGYWLLPEPPPRPLPVGVDATATSEAERAARAEASTAASRGGSAPPRAVRLPRAEWEATAKGGLGALFNALARLALYAAITGRTPVIPSVSCASEWMQRNAFGRAGVADDYVLQRPHRTRGGFHADGTDGGVECHLALGGPQCMLPNVLPAWVSAGSGALGFLGHAPPEDAPARRVAAQVEPASTPSSVRGGGDGLRCRRRAPRRLRLDVAALRALAAAHAKEPMLEIGSILRPQTGRDASASTRDGDGGGRAASAADTMAWRCRMPEELVEDEKATLLREEAARLGALRAFCLGYFAPRGTEPGQLEHIHRRRTKRGVEL